MASPENYKLVIIIKTIYINNYKSFLLFIITSRKKIIDNWVLENLIEIKYIKYMLTKYINNNIAIKYLNYLIKYLRARLDKP
jgi:hypothetical protein